MRGGTQLGEPGCDRLGSDAEAFLRQESIERSDTDYCPAAVDDRSAAVAGRESCVGLEHDAVAVELGRKLGERGMLRHCVAADLGRVGGAHRKSDRRHARRRRRPRSCEAERAHRGRRLRPQQREVVPRQAALDRGGEVRPAVDQLYPRLLLDDVMVRQPLAVPDVECGAAADGGPHLEGRGFRAVDVVVQRARRGGVGLRRCRGRRRRGRRRGGLHRSGRRRRRGPVGGPRRILERTAPRARGGRERHERDARDEHGERRPADCAHASAILHGIAPEPRPPRRYAVAVEGATLRGGAGVPHA